MQLQQITRTRITNTLGVLKLVGGIVLVVAISDQIVYGDHLHLTPKYLRTQFVVCLLFLADFFVRWYAAEPRSNFFLRNIVFFIISVPYLNLVSWGSITPSRQETLLLGLMPLFRAFLASYIVVRWLAGGTVKRLFGAYIFTVFIFTYLSALVFYEYEILVNPDLHNFGDALWWAWMNVTTVGAQIFAVTPIGKVITVILPTLGMMMFPIFTSYILQVYTRHTDKKGSPHNDEPKLGITNEPETPISSPSTNRESQPAKSPLS